MLILCLLHLYHNRKISFYHHRSKRDANPATAPLEGPHTLQSEEALSQHEAERKNYLEQSPRQARGWCKDSHGVFCMLYNVFNGKNEKVIINLQLKIKYFLACIKTLK